MVLADLKYADVTESGEDWRPIAARLFSQPPLQIAERWYLPNVVRKERQIATLLHWMAYPEMQRRLEMRARRDFSYPTLDVFLEELVALTLAYPSVSKDLVRIISLGRELRLNLFTTAYFLGGDEVSAAALLDISRKELSELLRASNVVLGQEIGMMRNNYVLPQAALVRLGYSSNAAIYHLLGAADDFELPRQDLTQRSYSVPTTPQPAVPEGTPRSRGQSRLSPFLRNAFLGTARRPRTPSCCSPRNRERRS